MTAIDLVQTSPRGELLIVACRSGGRLARRIVEEYERLDAGKRDARANLFLEDIDSQFSDSETTVQLSQDVSGRDVFIVQALHDPTSERTIDQNYMALLIAVRACREWGANHVTAILPYLAYARQDKPAPFQREPTSAKLMADFAIAAGIDRLVTWHPHLPQIHGFYGKTPVIAVDSLGLFIARFERFRARDDVLAVAPDAGAIKFVTQFARALELPCAIGSKYRPRPEEAVISELIGSTRGIRTAIVLDDMISSGGTISALVEELTAESDVESVYIAASHNLCLEPARRRLVALHEAHGVQELFVTNTIPQTRAFSELPFVSILDVSGRLAELIYRIHHNKSLDHAFSRLAGAEPASVGGA